MYDTVMLTSGTGKYAMLLQYLKYTRERLYFKVSNASIHKGDMNIHKI